MTLRISDRLKTDLLNHLATNNHFFQEEDDTYAKYDQIDILFQLDKTTVTVYYQKKLVGSISSPTIELDCTLHLTDLHGGIKITVENP